MRRAKRTSTQSVTSSTTLVDDNTLQLDLSPGSYEVSTKLIVTCASVAADLKVAWTFDGTISGATGRICQGPAVLTTDATDTNMRFSSHGFSTAVAYGIDASVGSCVEESMDLVVTVAGRLKLQWAQNGSSVTSTVMEAGSRIIARRVD